LRPLTINWPIVACGAIAVTAATAAILTLNRGSATDVTLKTVPVNYTTRTTVLPKPALSVAKTAGPAKPASSAARPVHTDYYARAIRGNLFSAPVPPEPKEAAPKPAHLAVKVPQIPPPDPLADAVFAGSVTKDGKTAALIQSRATGEGTYVTTGGHWNGFSVSSVSPREIELTRNGTHRTLERSDTINVVQLSASAPQPQTPVASAVPAGPPQNASAAAAAAAAAAARSYQAAQRNEQRMMWRQQRNQQRAWRSMFNQFAPRGGQYSGR